MNKPAAIYARVSSDRQKENHTIASQTAALIEYAQTHGYGVPPEWVFQDEGYSGAILVRPGLERLRDLAAEGQIDAALVYSPDRLSRKYAYQILLSEELSRCGVELIFLKAPAGATPEDQLLLQFQGMIAAYERAQIVERCRRGKKHMAQQGGVNVLSGAPYGYRYVKKSDTSTAFYEVVEAEAKVVRMVFEIYTQQRLSINAIARLLNERQIVTRTGTGRWERSTVWGMLRNPAYRGTAGYGKTEQRLRQRVTRPLRQRKALPSRDVGGHERPRAEWIEVPLPALVSEEMFALAQEQLEKNKRRAAAHRRADLAARHAGLRTVRLRLVPHLHPHVEAKTELLSLHRFGWISTAKRAGLCESSNQTKLSGSVRVERDHPAAGRSWAYPDRNRSPPPGRTKGGPIAQARRRITPGTGSRGERQRTPGDGLPRGIADPFPTTAKDAVIAKTNAGSRIGTTISEDGGGRRSQISATGREPGGISQQAAVSRRGAGYRGATADSAPAGEGSLGWK
jgi:DNA invertase Pin-like site-specific DNA recombinase